MRRIHHGYKKKFRLGSNDFVFIGADVSNMLSYNTNVWYELFVTNLLLFEHQQKTAR